MKGQGLFEYALIGVLVLVVIIVIIVLLAGLGKPVGVCPRDIPGARLAVITTNEGQYTCIYDGGKLYTVSFDANP